MKTFGYRELLDCVSNQLGPALHQFHGPCLWQETLQAITGGDRSKVILNIGRALGK